jgi:hypothetical protein
VQRQGERIAKRELYLRVRAQDAVLQAHAAICHATIYVCVFRALARDQAEGERRVLRADLPAAAAEQMALQLSDKEQFAVFRGSLTDFRLADVIQDLHVLPQ